MRSVRRPVIAAALVAGLVLVGLPTAAAGGYPGGIAPLLAFEASFTAMLSLAIPRPRSYAYTFLAGLLFLGFWVKFNLHAAFDYPYQEPIGSFDGSGASWDRALLMASCAALGVSVARLVALGGKARRSDRRPSPAEPVHVPAWFAERRRLVWIATLAGALALYAVNLAFAFYAIGVDQRLTLPLHGNIVVAWLVKLGLALWIATLVGWELRLARVGPATVFLAPIAEAALTGVSALSRGMYLYRAIPYGVALLDRSARPLRDAGRGRVLGLAALALAGFALSVGATSVLRLLVYPTSDQAQTAAAAPAAPAAAAPAAAPPRAPAEPSPATAEASRLDPQRVSFAVREVRSLVVERWNGMEGVMAISAHDGTGGNLLRAAIEEDPARGQDSIYQRIAAADQVYAQVRGYTFLTLPGIVGVLGYAGSLALVAAGMALLTAVVLAIEGFFWRLVANRYVAALAGFAMANELTQANFPYLLAAFFSLLVLSLAAIAVITLGPRRPAPWRRHGARRAA